LMGSGAEAASIGYWPPQQVIRIRGAIKPTDDAWFKRSIAHFSKATKVALNSQGGNTIAALNIGRMINAHHLDTEVPNGASCMSACALIWAAGANRVKSWQGNIGFHASYRSATDRTEAGWSNALIGAYLSKLGYSDQAIVTMTMMPPDRLYLLKDSDAASIPFKTEYDKPLGGIDPLTGATKLFPINP
jgi:hypothetical protein